MVGGRTFVGKISFGIMAVPDGCCLCGLSEGKKGGLSVALLIECTMLLLLGRRGGCTIGFPSASTWPLF